MGIINVTPDSFSDGGKYFTVDEAVKRARNMVSEGADIIDIGAESTRPGAVPIEWDEEWERLAPVLESIKGIGAVVSVDTYHPETAEHAVASGATIVNCVYPEPVLDMLQICSKNGAELVIPAKSLGSVSKSLGSVPIYLDPMIGFGTTREEDLEILQTIPELAKKGRVLIGASRKRIVKRLTGEKVPGKDLAGNLTIALWAAMNGASVVRVHDVRETVQALKVLAALKGEALPE
jgi:dihydropteroate synthase